MLHDPAGVTMIAIRLSLSLRKKRLNDPEQPRVVEGQAPPLLNIEIHLLLLAGEAQSVPQSGWHSVLELLLPSFQRPPHILVHYPRTLCQFHLAPLDMRLKLRTTTETTMTTTTSLAGDPEDP